ncbi:transmembrane emp24 domain-containing protein 7-like [Lethenteron reissneri]|uniref:transmembrane emp24 domain-containing protein 7-like n=1 Tax=Lethenteron reissneri TaxID=7753 RepID=UPI002AB7E96F|nr:transmembrane emp24 domain-containing protein 7-like [Lethenteron reissneri]
MERLIRTALALLLHASLLCAAEVTFELKDNAKQCFYEDIDQGVKVTLDFQVITGGNYDVDCRVKGPHDSVLYNENRKQYDSYAWTTEQRGTYEICFSNEFSTFTHKTVYFDLQVGEEAPLFRDEGTRVVALTQMESACVTIHEGLKSVDNYQTQHRLQETQDRHQAEVLNSRVNIWSIGETVILVVVGVGQVMLLKSFFSDKKGGSTRVGL